MTEKQQTAVQWLKHELNKEGSASVAFKHLFDEALVMEHLQTESAYEMGYYDGKNDFQGTISCECLKVRTTMVACCNRCGKATDEHWIIMNRLKKGLPKK